MASIAYASPAQEAAGVIRQQMTNAVRSVSTAVTNMLNVTKQQGRANIDSAFGASAADFAANYAALKALLEGFGVTNVPDLPASVPAQQ